MFFHISDQPDITRFEPRPSQYTDEPVVWAISEVRLVNYLLPRDCPRVTYYAGPDTSPADVERFLGTSPAVIAIETGWFDRVRTARLYCYHFSEAGFACSDECAGYYLSREAVVPQRIGVIDDVLAALCDRGVELRVMPSLWTLRDAVVASTLQYSLIRMRNAAPRIVGAMPASPI
jgi:hypothetical protein